ncbi:B3 domain-containing protein REM16 [Linum grandiflorum]
MESGSQTCSWEEEIYWNNFQYTHFSSFLHWDFNTRLVIPRTFAKKMGTKLPATVTLKGPSGNSWTVGLASSNDETVFFSSGWREFAQDHCLQPTDLLIFRYNGDSLFDVLVFDLESSCEKPSSYFARKQHTRKKIRVEVDTPPTSAGFIAPSPGQQHPNAPPVISELPNKHARTGSTKPTTIHDWKSAAAKSRRRALKLAACFKQGWRKKIGGSSATTSAAGSGGFVASMPQIHHNDYLDGRDGKHIPSPPNKPAKDCFDATPPLPSCPPVISELPSKRVRAEMENPVNCSGWKPAAEEPNQNVPKSASYIFDQNQEMGGSAATSVSYEGFVCKDGDNNGTPPRAEKYAEDGLDTKTPPLPTCPPRISELSNKRARAELTKPVVSITNNNCSSGWKTVSEESKLKAIKAARLALREDGFITVMKITNVKTCFYMTIPMAWMKKHMDERVKQEVILRVGGREWRVRFKLREKRDSGGLTHGWRRFAEDNNLQQFDVCLFQPSKSHYSIPGVEAADIVFEVTIFRCGNQ